MLAAPDASLHAPPTASTARVVFVRERVQPPDEPHGIAANPTPVHVIDERGELVGDLAPGTWFATELPPGQHLFVSYHDRTIGSHEMSVLRATLAPGRSYFVDLTRSRGTLFTYGRLHLTHAPLPLEPRPDLAPLVADAAAARHWSEAEAVAIRARLDEARALVDTGKFEVLRMEDGLLGAGPEGL